MKFSLEDCEMGRQVNCLDLLGLVSQHELGSLALGTAISIEVTALQVHVTALQGIALRWKYKWIELPPRWVLQLAREKWQPDFVPPLLPVPLSSVNW